MLQIFRLCFFIIVALAVAVHDMRTYRIPDFYLILSLSFFVGFDLLFSPYDFVSHLTGFLAGGFFLFFIYILTKEGLGLGDVKYSAVIGYFLGIFFWAGALFTASICGISFFIILHIIKKTSGQTHYI